MLKQEETAIRTNQVKESEIGYQEYKLFNFSNGNSPFRIQKSLNKVRLTMEVDTGATFRYASLLEVLAKKGHF